VDTQAAFTVATQIALGISLAACAGLRAFLPLLIIAILSRTGHLSLGEAFSWIGSNPALVIFGTATLVEMVGDKFPAIDNFLDTAGAFVKPVAGTILFSAAIVRVEPLTAIVLGIIAGGSISELIHLKKASLRAASTGVTLGMANPIISVLEDISSCIGVALSVIAPMAAACIIIVALYMAFRLISAQTAKKKTG